MEVGEYEKDETELFAKLLPYHDTVINIGANIGFYTCLALQNKKRVIAVEPIERNLRFLLANIEKNNWANECVEIFR
jgi:FkbM family methyltransferase